MNKLKGEDWEKEISKILDKVGFPILKDENGEHTYFRRTEVEKELNDLISCSRLSLIEELEEKIERMKEKPKIDCDGYKQCCSDFLKLLEERKI